MEQNNLLKKPDFQKSLGCPKEHVPAAVVVIMDVVLRAIILRMLTAKLCLKMDNTKTVDKTKSMKSIKIHKSAPLELYD